MRPTVTVTLGSLRARRRVQVCQTALCGLAIYSEWAASSGLPAIVLFISLLRMPDSSAYGYLGTAPPFSCKRRALLGEVKLHESCANGTLCCSSSVCGDSPDFLAIILTVCCSCQCRSAFNVAVVACTGRALRKHPTHKRG